MNQDTLMNKVCSFIVDKRRTIFIAFAAMAVFCAISRGWVLVCDSLTAYLSDDTQTRISLDLMESEFIDYGTADIMIDNITYNEAYAIKEQLLEMEGVKDVVFDNTNDHFHTAEALYEVTFTGTKDDEVSINALASIEEALSGYDLYVNTQVGNPLKTIIDKEMLIVDGIAVLIIVLVLLLTSKTFAEIPVLLITFGAAALLNMGTNFLFGEISFVTNSIAIVLQLALAIDYAIILCHRYMEEREKMEPREAAITALSKAIPEISASSLTTISGLLALCFMQYKLGADIGIIMIKAILLSLFSVFVLMPGLLVAFSEAIDNTHHRNFVPKISFVGKFAYLTRMVIPPVFVLILAGAFYCSTHATYVYDQYSIESVRKNEMQEAKERIEETFGRKNVVAIIVPYGEFNKEKALISDLNNLAAVKSVTGLSDIEAEDGYMLTDSLVPREFAELLNMDVEVARVIYSAYAAEKEEYGKVLTNVDGYSIPLIDIFDYMLEMRDDMDISLSQETSDRLDDLKEQLDDGKDQLMSEEWARIVCYLDLPIESQDSYNCIDVIRGVAAKYYDTCYLAGDTTACVDLKDSFEHDNLLISLLTIAFVVTVLILTFQSVGLPILLIMIIQGSIWLNFSSPYLNKGKLFFLTYLIISAIQMGANIDYAIVISSRYMELKKKYELKEAMVRALNFAFPTIITSGTMLALAGMVIGFVTSNETISSIGIYLGTGTFISIFLVMFVLPQMLLFGDAIIQSTSFEFQTIKPVKRAGSMRIDGRVKGNLSGYIDAEVHGVFRGDLNAVIDMLSMEENADATESTGSEEEGFLDEDCDPKEDIFSGAKKSEEEES